MRGGGNITVAACALFAVGLAPNQAKAEDVPAATNTLHQSGSSAVAGATATRKAIGISGNPAATAETAGTGWLGRQLGLKDGWELGGVWVGSGNYLMSGGINPGATFNSQLILNLHADLERTHGLKGSAVGIQFLQLNNDPTNDDAGTVLGYNSLDSTPPVNRTSLVQVWWRQEMFDERLILRVGKSNPGGDFANVVRPVLTTAPQRNIGVVTSLLYGPLYTPATLYNVFPGFYETAFGVTSTWAPNDQFYVAYGVYDGNQARGVATGLRGPEFNGDYFHIAETGRNWLWGPEDKPGSIAVGAFRQTGELSADNGVTENGATGVYVIGSQQLWYRDAEPIDNAGISAFFQVGWNDTTTLPIEFFVGAGLTFRGLVRGRPKDSFGLGTAWAQLNPNVFETSSEFIAQGYYQAHVTGPVYTEFALSYIPDPAAEPGIPPAWAVTQQLTVAF